MGLHAARVLKHFWAEPLVLYCREVRRNWNRNSGHHKPQPTDQETYKPSQYGREGHVNCIAFEESSPYNFEMERQIYIMIVCVRTKLSRKHNQQKKKEKNENKTRITPGTYWNDSKSGLSRVETQVYPPGANSSPCFPIRNGSASVWKTVLQFTERWHPQCRCSSSRTRKIPLLTAVLKFMQKS